MGGSQTLPEVLIIALGPWWLQQEVSAGHRRDRTG